ncbi:MAG: hypothetical protein QNJ41_00970 [Xenococcaceae cyanobacterium MO_188.B32]|nr:hypothetical protein [Xenococcaceae cyanobacterium MO_188.B32]
MNSIDKDKRVVHSIDDGSELLSVEVRENKSLKNIVTAIVKNTLAYGLLLTCAVLLGDLALGQNSRIPLHQTKTTKIQSDNYGEQLGTVRFPVSCNELAHQHTERGLALLHHMTYEDARARFALATKADPECAMGYWGQAMSYIHPLWSDPPSRENFVKGQELVDEAKTRGQKTEWEKAYIDAVAAYYSPGWSRDEKPNLVGFEEGWQKVYHEFPEDPEATSIYALAHMGTAEPSDKSYVKQKRAAELAKQVLAEIPNHPGAHHYIIHAYDYPQLAEEALEVARSYGKIAPEIPHALHMPSHIFTRLGLWQESIAMNKRSADAALKHPVGEKISLHYPHALDYLAYAYLQRAEDTQAKYVLDLIKNIEDPVQPHVASAYTLTSLPARLALEQQKWTDAISLQPRVPRDYPWNQFPAMEAITHFARALGAARSGNETIARQALDELALLRDRAAETSAYWGKQIEIQRLAAKAWLIYQEGDRQEALEVMREAAEMEASTEKHPVTPGEILPASELLADMLLEEGRYQEAQTAYLNVLKRSPNRFNSLYGAGRAAELKGNDNQANFYYRKLIEITDPEAERERLQYVRDFLAKN